MEIRLFAIARKTKKTGWVGYYSKHNGFNRSIKKAEQYYEGVNIANVVTVNAAFYEYYLVQIK